MTLLRLSESIEMLFHKYHKPITDQLATQAAVSPAAASTEDV